MQSIFCVCPPGQAQWTTRFFRALHQGCIPVTFWVNADMAFNGLGLDFSEFTVNVSPPQIIGVNHMLLAILNDPPRLTKMQRALAAAQHYFSWNPDVEGNAAVSVTTMLQARGAALQARSSDGGSSSGKCSQPKESVLKRLAAQEAGFQADIVKGNPFMHWRWLKR